MVEVTGLEPATSASRTQRSTKLSHTSLNFKTQHANYIIKLCQMSILFKLESAQEEELNKGRKGKQDLNRRKIKFSNSKSVKGKDENFKHRYHGFQRA